MPRFQVWGLLPSHLPSERGHGRYFQCVWGNNLGLCSFEVAKKYTRIWIHSHTFIQIINIGQWHACLLLSRIYCRSRVAVVPRWILPVFQLLTSRLRGDHMIVKWVLRQWEWLRMGEKLIEYLYRLQSTYTRPQENTNFGRSAPIWF